MIVVDSSVWIDHFNGVNNRPQALLTRLLGDDADLLIGDLILQEVLRGATFCIAEKHVLLHNDRDFDPSEKHLGLKTLR